MSAYAHDLIARLHERAEGNRQSSLLDEAAGAIATLLADRAELLAALNGLRDEMDTGDQFWGKLREAVDAADATINRAEGRS